MDVFFQMPSFVTILDFVGTFAFAISGIRLASAKRFDWFGAYVVGLATAIGGGTIRDVLLDVTPAWMTDPMYLICTAFAMFFVILFGKYVIRLNNTFFIFDTIGLALFTVVGFSKAYALGYPFWIAIIMGSITGAAGGVLRDIFINEIPLIFRKEIYAMACVIGGLVYWICLMLDMESVLAQIIGGVTVFVARILAVKYKIVHVRAGFSGIVFSWIRQTGCNKRTLFAGELRGRGVKVSFRHGFCSIYTIPHFDGIQVNFHDSFFIPYQFNQYREIDFESFSDPGRGGP